MMSLEARVSALGPWFHNLRLGQAAEVQTAPDHPLGDFPANFWGFFKHVVPDDLSGRSVLDIGCNGGFYSFEMKRRGAARVLGVDHDPAYLNQARFAAQELGLDVEFEQGDVYDIDRIVGGQRFDFVVFMGVLYHLRHPLYALEKVAALVEQRLLFQTMERGAWESAEFARDYPFSERDVFFEERFPRMFFIEHAYAGDHTNWWIPNPACTRALLRSTGLRIVDQPCHEVYLCEPAS
jgi:tRNA (mo5U34)-methyltransferase